MHGQGVSTVKKDSLQFIINIQHICCSCTYRCSEFSDCDDGSSVGSTTTTESDEEYNIENEDEEYNIESLLDGRRETEETNLLPFMDIDESTTSTSTTKGEEIEDEEEIIRLLEGKGMDTQETNLAKKRYKQCKTF